MHHLRRSARVFYMQADPEDNRDIALPPTSLARLPRLPACLPACTVDCTMDVYVSRGEAQRIPLLRRYWGPEKRGTVRHLFY